MADRPLVDNLSKYEKNLKSYLFSYRILRTFLFRVIDYMIANSSHGRDWAHYCSLFHKPNGRQTACGQNCEVFNDSLYCNEINNCMIANSSQGRDLADYFSLFHKPNGRQTACGQSVQIWKKPKKLFIQLSNSANFSLSRNWLHNCELFARQRLSSLL
jgi:hypothetical protein